MAISGIREGRLLMKGYTDIGRAAKNIVVDGAAVGGGGLIGAKTGVLIGSIGGPVGSVIGGIIGGIAGAIGGRFVANDIKRQPLMDAKNVYDSALSKYKAEEARVSNYSSTEWLKARTTEQAKLRKELDIVRANYEAHIKSIREQLKTDLTLTRNDAEKMIAAAREAMEILRAEAERNFRNSTNGIGRILPGLKAPVETAQYKKITKDIREWEMAAIALSQNWSATPEHTVKIFDLVLAISDFERKAEDFVSVVINSRQQRYASLQVTYHKFLATAVTLRKHATDRLRATWEEIAAIAEKMLAPAIQSLRVAGENYKAEFRKNGVEV